MTKERMYRAIYKGPLAHLHGEGALVLVPDPPTGRLTAQFDRPVTRSGPDSYVDTGPDLCMNWHGFPVGDFDIAADLEFE